jgi:hypothetical protein
MAMMCCVGPEGNTGSLVCLRKLLGHKVNDDGPAAADRTQTDLAEIKKGP